MAATGALALVATISKPGGGSATKSPWLAQTCSSRGSEANSRPPLVVIVACPNSRFGAGPTMPPRASVMSCMP